MPAIRPFEKCPINNPANAAINADKAIINSSGRIPLTVIFIQTRAVIIADKIPPKNPNVIF